MWLMSVLLSKQIKHLLICPMLFEYFHENSYKWSPFSLKHLSAYKQTEEPRQLELSQASLFHFPVALLKGNWHDMPVNRCQKLCFLSRMKGAEAGKQGKVRFSREKQNRSVQI